MATAAMEAFLSATKATQAPRSTEELQNVLSELPRRELQALGKAHGVQATLKRESLVTKLLDVLAALMWPAPNAQENEKVEEEDDAVDVEEKEHVATSTVTADVVAVVEEEKTATVDVKEPTNVMTAMTEKATSVVVKKTTVVSTTTTNTKKALATAAAVGKKTVATSTRGRGRGGGTALSPGKLKKATPVKATATTPSKTMEKIHAKRVAKQPTLQEHEQAKKQRAALLLSGSKYSVVKKTRSKTKELTEDGVGENDETSVTKTLSFGAATPAKKVPSTMPKKTATPSTDPVSKETAKKAKTGAYKPYAGPLPAFEGDSLFSPRKSTPRPAPMAVAVMKAVRTAAPKKPATASTAATTKKATPAKKSPAKKATPTKKSPAKKSPSKKATPTKKSPAKSATPTKKSPTTKTEPADKENAKPKVSASNMSKANGTKKTTTVTTKARASVKAAATTVISQQTKKEERRTKFSQDSKANSTATRRQARTVSTSTSTTKTSTTTATST